MNKQLEKQVEIRKRDVHLENQHFGPVTVIGATLIQQICRCLITVQDYDAASEWMQVNYISCGEIGQYL